MTAITLATNRHGEIHAHAAGCADLTRGNKYQRDSLGWTVNVETVDDITFEAWGASGVASDECSADWDSSEYRAFTLERYDGLVKVFPCVRLAQ